VINFGNTTARELLKLEKLHYYTEKGSLFWIYCESNTGPKFLKLCVDDPCAIMELWLNF